MNEHELTAAKAVEDFCKSELSDYGHFEGWKVVETEHHNNQVFVDVDVRNTTLRFRVTLGTGNPEDCKLEIDMSEDAWTEIETFTWKVKYFWMALLSWD